MLDVVTKRSIDTARDILVGKVPDPKSQVEQITIALIYKFMDDIDSESEELGGKREFFAGQFAKYRWPNLVGPGVGGHDALNLYSEAIARMPENPGIPQLFRNIFNNAYLPYRDPETLRAFLKIIDDFTYDDSESLGDAFEYLLSVLDAQGDAGQFRTPRHIIDFIVAIVDPKKDEVILDPACGTAGFLISSYKHILKANTDSEDQSTLTPDERGRLVNNFNGYDISPDFVRLSLVNMYLHGFREPNIHEYDTLTSEEKWNEFADVILANPPFMSPKGGIRPHNRFSVTSKRSEVLFVDYMAEHLTANGRAGIIVPEGVIFQSQKAHKELRKMLVENYLVAVVSLPAGVFNPYSGVKTSILILDRALAKRTNSIAFFKVENDGFDLGAQRRPIDGNDLSSVRDEVVAYLGSLKAIGHAAVASSLVSSVAETNARYTTNELSMGTVVEKSKIAADGEYSLSGERYKESRSRIHKFPTARIRELCTINPRKSELTNLSADTLVSFVPMADLHENRMTFQPKQEKLLADVSGSYTYFANNDVLLARVTPCFENGKAGIARGLLNGIGFGSSEFIVLRCGNDVMPEWMYFCVKHPLFRNWAVHQMTGTSGLQRVPRPSVAGFQIPLPPLEVQREVVAEIEGYQKVIDGARAVVENYRPHIAVDTQWPLVELGQICQIKGGKRLPRGSQYEDSVAGHRYIRVSDFRNRTVDVDAVRFISESVHQQISRYTISSSDVYISIAGTIGLIGTIPASLDGANLTENAAKLVVDPKLIDNRYLSIVGTGNVVQEQIRSLTHAVGVPKLALRRIAMLKVPLPPLEEQRKIVTEVEAEQALVTANQELIDRFEKKIEAAIARVWQPA